MKYLTCAVVVLGFLMVAEVRANDKALNGTWVGSEAMQNGEKVMDGFVKSAKLVLADGKYVASLGDITENGTYKVDTAKKPHALDMKAGDGQKKGKTTLGIVELDGDTLKVCFNLESSQRPKDFTSTAENKHFVVIYKRSK